ncbi:MAG: ThiF family adenylyltransferase [Herpetosiphonaceae bacterium]|nr:ThiF family adenylyltransferase [Herpetosiphonaceae bacterium]
MDHFSRTIPIIGTQLQAARVAVLGLSHAAPLVEYLAACGVGCWLWDGADYDQTVLKVALAHHHGAALALDAAPLSAQTLAAAPPDLVVGLGAAPLLRQTVEWAHSVGAPALLVVPGGVASPWAARVVLPNNDDDQARTAQFIQLSHGWPAAAPGLEPALFLVAGLARALLLRRTEFARADLAELWAAGQRELHFAAPSDPGAVTLEVPTPPPAAFRTPPARRGALLIAGLGSLGSVAALALADAAERLVIADPDHVDVANPVRQAFAVDTIGQPKASALRTSLLAAGAPAVFAYAEALETEQQVAALIAEHSITAALVTTGTAADFAIARALRQADLPHVVGRCYPRARYWEALVIDGRRGPALSDLRGHLALGPAPNPTPEQIAAYSDAGALEAEPATLIESGWAAAWLARLVRQLLAPPGLRERWLLELLAAERTCLIGGVQVEPTADGPAYGIALPGQVRALGRANIRQP